MTQLSDVAVLPTNPTSTGRERLLRRFPELLQDALDKLAGGKIDFREFKKCVA